MRANLSRYQHFDTLCVVVFAGLGNGCHSLIQRWYNAEETIAKLEKEGISSERVMTLANRWEWLKSQQLPSPSSLDDCEKLRSLDFLWLEKFKRRQGSRPILGLTSKNKWKLIGLKGNEKLSLKNFEILKTLFPDSDLSLAEPRSENDSFTHCVRADGLIYDLRTTFSLTQALEEPIADLMKQSLQPHLKEEGGGGEAVESSWIDEHIFLELSETLRTPFISSGVEKAYLSTLEALNQILSKGHDDRTCGIDQFRKSLKAIEVAKDHLRCIQGVANEISSDLRRLAPLFLVISRPIVHRDNEFPSDAPRGVVKIDEETGHPIKPADWDGHDWFSFKEPTTIKEAMKETKTIPATATTTPRRHRLVERATHLPRRSVLWNQEIKSLFMRTREMIVYARYIENLRLKENGDFNYYWKAIEAGNSLGGILSELLRSESHTMTDATIDGLCHRGENIFGDIVTYKNQFKFEKLMQSKQKRE